MNRENISVLIPKSELEARIAEVGAQISRDYKDKDLTLICVLKGGVIFLAELARRIDLDLELDFMSISSYGTETVSSGVVKINLDISGSIEGKDVLLVEDIVDTGRSMSYVLSHLESKRPESLKICALLDKPSRRVINVKPDYTCFVIPDKFVVGYGMDYNHKYRNLDYIGVI